MKNFFSPKSIAVLASFNNCDSFGLTILQNIIQNGFLGRIFTVDPESTTALGFKNYAFITEIPSQIDLAILNYSNKELSYFLNLCGEKGIKNVILLPTKNNKNVKNENFQKQLQELARKNNLNILGPNSLGIINLQDKINISLQPQGGQIGVVSLFSQGIDAGQIFLNKIPQLKINKWISSGSIELIPQSEIINYLLADKFSKVICLWLEKIDEPELIASIYQKYKGNKVLIIYSNQTRDFPILSKNGIIIAKNPNQMLALAKVFSTQKIKLVQKTLLITNYDKLLSNFGGIFAKYNLNISKIVQTNFENCELISASDIKNSDAIILVLRPQIPNINLLTLKKLITFCRKFSITLIPIFIQNDNPQLNKIFDQTNILHYDNFQEPLVILNNINKWITNKNQNKIYIRLFTKQNQKNEFSLGI